MANRRPRGDARSHTGYQADSDGAITSASPTVPGLSYQTYRDLKAVSCTSTELDARSTPGLRDNKGTLALRGR